MNDLTVYKSNALVQASYKLSINEQRIILNCIGQLNSNEEVTDEVMYRVAVQDILDQGELDLKNAYKNIKAAALRLRRREITIPEPTRKLEDRMVVTGWVQTIRYSDSDASVELRFSKDILPYLTQLKAQFTKYKLKHVAKMKSSYGIRLYELLVQHIQFGSRHIEIAWLRKQFQLESKYKAIKDFKLRVIEPALKDINETSDLWVKYSQRKTGRKVTHLIFEFGPKESFSQNQKKLTREYIEKNANPGEAWEDAKNRLSTQFREAVRG